jgi:uncharacterized protein with PQ loop repeat
MILLDSFIIFGMIISYTPQYIKILSLQNSFGFSPNFFLLGSIGVVSTLSNLVLLQFFVILNCFTHNTDILECISNLFGIVEIFVQFCCFFALFGLFLWFFPVQSLETLPTTARADSETCPTNPTDDAVITDNAAATGNADATDNTPATDNADSTENADANNKANPSGNSDPSGNADNADTPDNDDADQESIKLIWQHSKRNAWSSLLFLFLSVLIVSISLLYCSSETNTQIALVYGLLSTICGIVQFFPQLLYTIYTRKVGSLSIGTMILQVPGSFILALSLYSTPGSNWSSYISYLISGLLQGSLLIVCLSLKQNVSEEEEVLLPD